MGYEHKGDIYTIGHSVHSATFFLELLQSYNINCLIDVRSVPASNYSPQFNREVLDSLLKRNGIQYMHFGNEFGARHENPDIMDDKGIVNFEIFRESHDFQQGVERVKLGLSKNYKIVLMCSEGDPFKCHRFSMISPYLEMVGIHVKHILKDKTIKTQAELEQELIKKYEGKEINQLHLFDSGLHEDKPIKRAYRLHNKEIGWQSNSFLL